MVGKIKKMFEIFSNGYSVWCLGVLIIIFTHAKAKLFRRILFLSVKDSFIT